MDVRQIDTAGGPLDATLHAVPSKSVTHRALVAAALADGDSVLVNPLDADDTRATRDGLVRLGMEIRTEPGRWLVTGSAGRVAGGGTLALGASGTSMRLLAAVAALGKAPSRLDGVPRLRERPMEELLGALSSLGGDLRVDAQTAGLPLVAGGRPMRGGPVRVAGGRSSQFASALLLIAPGLEGGVELTIEPPAVSLPYVELTAGVLESFGAEVERLGELRWRVAPGKLSGRRYVVEGDHSSASYFLAAAAVAGGRVRVTGLVPGSSQPDARLGAFLERLGCTVHTGDDHVEVVGTRRIPAFDLDLTDAPDLAPTVAVLALFADGACVIRGVAHLRHKESDRLELLARNLRALGRDATAMQDRLMVGRPPPCLGASRIETGSDHRIAMAFAVAGLRLSGVELDDADCVGKSSPDFWSQHADLCRGRG